MSRVFWFALVLLLPIAWAQQTGSSWTQDSIPGLIVRGNRHDIRNVLQTVPGIDVNYRYQPGNLTALVFAVSLDQREVVDELVHTPGIDVNVRIDDNVTALALSVYNGFWDITEILLQSPTVDVNRPNVHTGETPLHLAIHKGHMESIRLLLQKHAQVHLTDNRKRTALHLAVATNRHILFYMVLMQGQNVPLNAQDEDGDTALHTAVALGHRDIVQDLCLQPLLQIHLQNKKGRTPLHLAAMLPTGQDLIRTMLTRHGAQPTAAAAAVDLLDTNHDTALCIATRSDHVDTVLQLLHFTVNERVYCKDGITPLGHVIANNRPDLVRQMVSVHPNMVHWVDQNDKSPLHIAALLDRAEIVRILVQQPQIQVNQKGLKSGITAMHIAAAQGHDDVVLQLLKSPAIDLTIKDASGHTAQQMAQAKGHVSIVSMLVRKAIVQDVDALRKLEFIDAETHSGTRPFKDDL
jgi:ankyrin repeat protein